MDEADKALMQQRLRDTRFVVEATDFEYLCLWERHSLESNPDILRTRGRKRHWEQLNPGYLTTAGVLNDLPVCVHLRWAKIDGVLVMFYEAVSRVVDRDMVRQWLKDNCWPEWDGRAAKEDAMNFHIALQCIDTINSR